MAKKMALDTDGWELLQYNSTWMYEVVSAISYASYCRIFPLSAPRSLESTSRPFLVQYILPLRRITLFYIAFAGSIIRLPFSLASGTDSMVPKTTGRSVGDWPFSEVVLPRPCSCRGKA